MMTLLRAIKGDTIFHFLRKLCLRICICVFSHPSLPDHPWSPGSPSASRDCCCCCCCCTVMFLQTLQGSTAAAAVRTPTCMYVPVSVLKRGHSTHVTAVPRK